MAESGAGSGMKQRAAGMPGARCFSFDACFLNKNSGEIRDVPVLSRAFWPNRRALRAGLPGKKRTNSGKF